jgi:hypothetical protein
MKVLRSRAPEQVRRDALKVAERKAAEGCMPCAEAYLSVAEQNGATAQEIDHTRRRLFARAGALAGVGLAASLVDIGSLVAGAAAAPPTDNPLVLLDAASAGRLHRAALGHPDVEQLRSSLGATGPGDLVAFRDRGGSGVFLVETVAPGAMLAYLAGRGHAGAAASQGDTVFAVQGGRVAAHAAATTRFRELRATVSTRSLAQTAAELLGPKTAHAACPYCFQLLFACAAGVVTCGAGCGPCCMLGGSACLLAVTCCNS